VAGPAGRRVGDEREELDASVLLPIGLAALATSGIYRADERR
jgi:hypothetical protein